jgi:hypothetical protein
VGPLDPKSKKPKVGSQS